MAAGGLGFLAYDLKNHLETLPHTAADDLHLPEMVLAFPRRLVVHDRRAGRFWSPGNLGGRPGTAWPGGMATVRPAGRAPGAYRVGRPASNFTREAYLTAVSRIRDYIRQGDVYQVNLSQRFSFPLPGRPTPVPAALPAQPGALLRLSCNCGDFQVLSTSMERFLYRRGDYLETRPIKGTRPRGATPAEDAALRQELAEAPRTTPSSP